MARYDALLLDHDGVLATLTDRSTLRAVAREALRDVGVSEPSRADAEAISINVSTADLRSVAERHGVAAADLWRRREARIEAVLRAAAAAGRKTLYDDVVALEDVDLPLGVVSNNQARIVEFVLEEHGVADRFETVRAREPTVESLEKRKPNPAYLEAAMADLGVSDPLYVGDSATDVRAAARAGVDAAFLRRSHNADRSLDAAPTHEIGGLDEIPGLL